MNETMGQDVNTEATSSVVEETVQHEATQEVDNSQSAETLNTEAESKTPESIPYNRFKEVNDQLKHYKENYGTFDKLLKEDRVFNTKINEVIDAYNKGELTQKQAQEAVEEAKTEAQDNNQPAYDPRVDELMGYVKEQTFNSYDREFRELASKDYEDPADVALIGEATSKILLNKNPNAFDKYKHGEVAKAYKEAKEMLEGFSKRRMGKYMDKKVSDAVPTVSTGAAPSKEVNLSNASRKDVASYLAEQLKAGSY